MNEEQAKDLTETRRMANAMMRWSERQWREWYGIQADHIERTANRASPDVRRTLEWSLPYLRSVQYGGLPPVLPPKAVRRRVSGKAPWQEVEGAASPPRRARLSLKAGKKAPVMKGMADVLEDD